MAVADWSDAAVYAPLLAADRSAFAWEWLRRSTAYRAQVALGGQAAAFGLVQWEDPDLPVWQARPIWRRSLDAAVLSCSMDGVGDPVDLGALAWPTKMIEDEGITHVLLGDGLRMIRVDITGAPCGPFVPRWSLAGMDALDAQLAALDRLVALASGYEPRPVRSRRSARWIAVLRVHDALAAGARYRDIAAALYGDRAVGPRWWLDTPSWGLRVSRLAAASRAALAAGPRPWLCSGSPASARPAR